MGLSITVHPLIPLKTITKTFSPRWKVRSHKLNSSLTRLSNLRSWQARRLQNNNLKFWTTKFKIHKIQKNFSLKFWTKLFSINLNYTVYILQIITSSLQFTMTWNLYQSLLVKMNKFTNFTYLQAYKIEKNISVWQVESLWSSRITQAKIKFEPVSSFNYKFMKFQSQSYFINLQVNLTPMSLFS